MLFVISLHSASFVFGKCIECKISCTSIVSIGGDPIGDFYILEGTGSGETKYSQGQTLSQDKYDKVSSVCKYCNVESYACDIASDYTHKCTCSKRTESIIGLEAIIDEEVETLLEEGAIASVGVLAVASLVPPPLPMFPPLGLPQPVAGGITQVAGGGVLPSAALTVSN